MRLNKDSKNKQVLLGKQREIYHRELVKKQDIAIAEGPVYDGDAFISLHHVNKIYKNHVQAVYDFNLEIKEKEFIVFVGPSGCGKSTTLRMIAGLEDITYGNLFFGKEFGNTLLPKERDCAMVFQNYALYPNMTVYDNLAFSLKVRKMDKATIHQKVLDAARILELSDYLGRKPGELSGGQRQRVALGRAIVRDARIFLMDEPLSNLDAKLRVQMRSELVSLHEKIGSTTIYVTHDQTEAMTMASRIVVMKDGYIQQIGTPKEIYNNPSNIFVATFIGSPAMNILKARLEKDAVILPNGLKLPISKDRLKALEEAIKEEIALLELEKTKIMEENQKLELPIEQQEDKFYRTHSFRKRIPDLVSLNLEKVDELDKRIAQLQEKIQSLSFDVYLGVRPEDIVSEKAASLLKRKSDPFSMYLDQVELLGNEYYVYSKIDGKKIIAKISANEEVEAKKEQSFHINLDRIHLFDIESEKRYF